MTHGTGFLLTVKKNKKKKKKNVTSFMGIESSYWG
jgi:hypothetical protein